MKQMRADHYFAMRQHSHVAVVFGEAFHTMALSVFLSQHVLSDTVA